MFCNVIWEKLINKNKIWKKKYNSDQEIQGWIELIIMFF